MILPNSTHHQMVPILTLEILWILAWIYGEILRIETIQHSLNMQNLNSIYHPRHPVNHIYDERERERERERTPLLPKLRGHFAEFLRHGSLKRPNILSHSPMSVWGQFIGRITPPKFEVSIK